MDELTLLNNAIEAAGGQTMVGIATERSQPTVFKWTKYGLPSTEWTGKTSYAVVISRLTIERFNAGLCDRIYTVDELLAYRGRPSVPQSEPQAQAAS